MDLEQRTAVLDLPDRPEPVAREINSVQVVRGEDRWWIAHLIWDVETPDNPIPEAYLRGKP